MVNEIKKQCDIKMQKTVESYRLTLAKIRTGRAHSGLLDHIQIDYYGTITPINQLATIIVSDVKTLTVQPWDAKMASTIEKAIRDSDLGLNPVGSGTIIRVPMPLITEERRKELIKVVKAEAEKAKTAIRNIRRDANNEFKEQFKNKLISEDIENRSQDEVQKYTDKHISEIEKLTLEKEKELLTV